MTRTLFNKPKAIVNVALLFLVALLAVLPASAQNYPPTWVYARDFNYSAIIGQQANTFTFNGGACQYSPSGGSVNGYVSSFFVFSGQQGGSAVYFPVFIQDATPTNNEIVTPSATTNTQTQCGFTASPANSHTSFNLLSGTGGLQEAIAYQLQNTPAFVVALDKSWYQIVSQFPATTTPQSIIGSVKGNANVYIADMTVAPWQFYSWNGTKYVAVATTGGVEFSSVTLGSAPSALSTASVTSGIISTATTGGTIPASSTYRLAATCVTPLGGETTISTDSASTSTIATGSGTATNTITVTDPGCTAANGFVGWRLYMSAASGASLSEILYAPTCTASTGQFVLNGVCAIGSSATITAVVTGTATVPATNTAFITTTASNSPLVSIVSFPPFTNVATINAAATGTLGAVNFASGFLNTLGRHLHVHGTGFGTTNSTPGTLTLATKLFSVPGVTSVTPFTAVSGTTTGSAVVNFTFDVDITTTATGASGTVEAHGTVCYNLAGTAVCTPAQDLITAASSAVDLTKQDQLDVTLTPATTAITTGGAQLRQLTVQVLQ